MLVVFVIMHFFAPPRHAFTRPLDLDADIGLATGTKVTFASLMPGDYCMNKLGTANALEFKQADPKRPKDPCGWDVAATMTQAAEVSFRPREVTAQCSVTLAGYIWLQEVDKSAQKLLGSGLKSVHHAGTYSCRRQRGNGSGAWSEHAFANAWDIMGFQLDDGRVISVLKDWDQGLTNESKARARFLRKARGSACRVFRVVLSPDFNEAHKDHFHLDQGPTLSCR
ncbi:MAG: extensin family protein [Acidimicrobiales bacterium]|nr:extensin family protein [Hyphomonadaceae bacterium]RZV40130.1 MAG: extensin family protein [Acidimicrobiales bacterium]